MRIAVVSPHQNNNGNTSLAMLIALELASTGKSTCISHTKPLSDSFYKYLNFIGYQDKTSTPSQIVKIIKEGGLSGEDVTDYCKRVSENLEAFTNNASNFSQMEMDFMVHYMLKSFPHEHLVLDVDSEDINKDIIELSDVIVLNINQSVVELTKFYENKEKIMSLLGNKPILVVVNNYNSINSTLKETANAMGIKKPNNWVVLHHNPWIAWATNHGQLNQLYTKIKAKDKRVIELNSDLYKIVSQLLKAKSSKKRAGGK